MGSGEEDGKEGGAGSGAMVPTPTSNSASAIGDGNFVAMGDLRVDRLAVTQNLEHNYSAMAELQATRLGKIATALAQSAKLPDEWPELASFGIEPKLSHNNVIRTRERIRIAAASHHEVEQILSDLSEAEDNSRTKCLVSIQTQYQRVRTAMMQERGLEDPQALLEHGDELFERTVEAVEALAGPMHGGPAPDDAATAAEKITVFGLMACCVLQRPPSGGED